MIKINVSSSSTIWKKYIKNPSSFIDKKLKLINKKNNLYKKNILICTLLLSGTKEIRELNKKFRNKNKSTDILSFPSNKKLKISKQTYLGDIIISFNYMNKPKSQTDKHFKEKIIKTFIHGFLHLLGFDHIKDKDYLKMLKEEEKIYQSVISKIK